LYNITSKLAGQQKQYVLHAQIQRDSSPRGWAKPWRQLAWPAGAIPAKLLISPERSPTLVLPTTGWWAASRARVLISPPCPSSPCRIPAGRS